MSMLLANLPSEVYLPSTGKQTMVPLSEGANATRHIFHIVWNSPSVNVCLPQGRHAAKPAPPDSPQVPKPHDFWPRARTRNDPLTETFGLPSLLAVAISAGPTSPIIFLASPVSFAILTPPFITSWILVWASQKDKALYSFNTLVTPQLSDLTPLVPLS
jgi:hypothetical protein